MHECKQRYTEVCMEVHTGEHGGAQRWEKTGFYTGLTQFNFV